MGREMVLIVYWPFELQSQLMQERMVQLNNLLECFLEVSSDPLVSNRAARELIYQSQREGFLDVAMTMLASWQLSWNKVTLLSCMIKDSFKYCFELVEGSRVDSYYLMLFTLAKQMGIKHKPLYNNIAETLAIIYINASAITDYSLTEFLDSFSPQNNFELYHYYFKVLQYCASEVSNSKIVLQKSYRQNAKKRLAQQQMFVLHDLNEKAKRVWDDPRIDKEPIIECLENWIDLSYNKQMLQVLPEVFVFRAVISTLKDQNYVDSATQCLKSVIYTIKSAEEDQKIYRFLLGLMCEVIPYINQILPLKQLPTVESLIRLVASFSKKFAATFIKNFCQPLSDSFIMPILNFFYPDMEGVVDSLIEFCDEFVVAAVNIKQQGWVLGQIKMTAFSMVLSLSEICEYPAHLIAKLNKIQQHRLSNHCSEGQIIYRYRINSTKIFEQVAELLGTSMFLDKVVEVIAKLDPNDDGFWGRLESYLYCLHSPLKNLELLTENAVFLVNTYEDVVDNQGNVPIIVRRTFLRLFRSMFSIKGRHPSLVMKLFYFTSQCFQDPYLLQTAERTYYRGCEENAQLMNPYISEMYEVLTLYPSQEYIVRGYICVACSNSHTAHINVDNCLQYLLLCMNDERSNWTKRKECLENLSAAVKQLGDFDFEERNSMLKSFTWQAWPYLISWLKEPRSKADDEDMHIERVVKLIKNIMRLIKTDFADFLPSLFEAVNQAFAKYPICSYVYLVEITITVFYKCPQAQDFLSNLYETFSNNAFNHLNTSQTIDKFGYLVDDYLGMSGRLIFYNTSIIISSRQFPKLLHFVSSDCLLTTSPKVIKATYNFMQSLFMLFWTPQLKAQYNQAQGNDLTAPVLQNESTYCQIKEFLLQQLGSIIHHMLQHLNEVPNQMTKDCILEALMSEIKAFPTENVEFWSQALQKLSADVLLQEQKEGMMRLLEQCRERSLQGGDLKQTLSRIFDGVNLISHRMAASEKRRHFKLSFK